jgi:DHA2 family multidrug resistance protein
LTDAFGWRWVFLINLPIGLVGLAGLLLFMPRVPANPSRFDAMGFALLLIAISSFQLMIDRGAQNDWFDSLETMIEAALAASAGWAFVIHIATASEPLMPRAIFRDRNLVVATVFILLMVGLVIASSALTPPLLQRLYGYDAYGAGLLTAPRGVGMAISMILGTRLSNLVDRRVVILVGLALTATSVRMMMHFSPDMNGEPVMWSGLVQGLGFGLVFLPLNLMAFGTLDPKYRTQGAGLYNLARSLSGSIAISIVTVILARQEQVAHADLAAHITEQRLPLPALTFTQQFGLAPGRVFGLIDAELNHQAAMVAYIDAFSLMFWMVIAASPLVLLLKVPRESPGKADETALAIE